MIKHIYALPTFLVLFSSSAIWGTDEAKGCKVGSAIIKPSIDVKEIYNDNIYTQRTVRVSDFITEVTPTLSIEASDTPHTLRLTTGLDQNWYARHSRDNATNYSIGANGRYMFNGGMFWDASGSYRHLHSSRGDNQADPTDNASKPLPYTMINADTSFYKRIEKFTMRPRLGLVGYDYQNVSRLNGGIIDQGGRNRIENTYGGEFGYDLPNKMSLFTDLEGNAHNYKRNYALKRTSHGGNYLVGLQYRPNTNILARLGGGYMHQEWSNKLYPNVRAWKAVARLDWQFNETTKLSSALRRVIDEVTDAGASAAVRTDLTATLSHALSEKVIGKIGVRYSQYNFQGGFGATGGTRDRKDNLYEGTLGLAYKYSGKVSFTTDYTYGRNKSNVFTSNYGKNVVMFGVKFGFFDK